MTSFSVSSSFAGTTGTNEYELLNNIREEFGTPVYMYSEQILEVIWNHRLQCLITDKFVCYGDMFATEASSGRVGFSEPIRSHR
jgi:hypothetical protein